MVATALWIVAIVFAVVCLVVVGGALLVGVRGVGRSMGSGGWAAALDRSVVMPVMGGVAAVAVWSQQARDLTDPGPLAALLGAVTLLAAGVLCWFLLRHARWRDRALRRGLIVAVLVVMLAAAWLHSVQVGVAVTVVALLWLWRLSSRRESVPGGRWRSGVRFVGLTAISVLVVGVGFLLAPQRVDLLRFQRASLSLTGASPRPNAASLEEVGAGAAAVVEGRIVYDVPTEMDLDRRSLVRVSVARGVTLDDEALLEGLGELNEPRIRSLETSSVMRVGLTGTPRTMFDIQPLSSYEQRLFGDSALWEFNVTPVEAGTGSISISASLVLEDGVDRGVKSIRSFLGEVDVRVTALRRITGFLSGSTAFAGPIGIAAASAVLARRGSRGPAFSRRLRGRRRVFISYRRADSGGWTTAIHERLQAEYGAGNVFMDVDDLMGGQDFESVIIERIEASEAFVAIIGLEWAASADGEHDINSDDDFVRREIAHAFAANVPVVPVLVDGAELPTRNEIPGDLHPMLKLHVITVATGQLDEGTTQLVRAIDHANTGRPSRFRDPSRAPAR